MSVEEIAKGLSEAQRRWLVKAERAWPLGPYCTYPSSNTHGALQRRRLMRFGPQLTLLGQQVRAYLETHNDQ